MKAIWRAQSTVSRLFLAALCLLFAVPLFAQSVESLSKPTDYVSDYAHVLSPEAVARLDALCSQLDHSQANSQIAIVTVPTLNGDDTASYATRLFEKWQIGKKGSDKGVLVLLAVNDRKRFIEVGYGLEGILNDAKLGDIGRAMVPYLRSNDYDSAVTLAVGQVAQVIAADAGVSLTAVGPMPNTRPEHARRSSPVLGKLIILVFLLIFFGGGSIFRLLLGYGLFSSIFGGGGRGGWGGGGDSGWGGGGFGGGGGGGGGFGGFGGGSTGGGGAGGSW